MHILIIEGIIMLGNDKEEHESFAMMGFSRINCAGEGVVLHGSELKHNTIIEMELHHSTKERGLSHDYHFADKMITRVAMSQNQFSEMITSMNMGSGIPVTLQYTERDGKLQPPEFGNITELHKNEFKQQAKDVATDANDLLTAMKEILAGSGTVKKVEREELINIAEKVVREIVANMPFMEKSFEKAMDDVVTDAKGSIEAFYQHRVVEAGLTALDGGNVPSPTLIETEQK